MTAPLQTSTTTENRFCGSLQPSQWASVVTQAQVGIALATIDTHCFISVNPAYATQRGYQPEELAGRSIFSIYAPDAHELIQDLLQEQQQADHLVYESLHVKKNGTPFPVRVEATLIRDESGQPAARMFWSVDISEQQAQAEQTIRYIQFQKAQLRLFTQDFDTCDQLLDALLDEVVNLTGSERVFLFSSEPASHLLTLYTWRCALYKSCMVHDVRHHFSLAESGNWGEAVRLRKPLLVNEPVVTVPLCTGCQVKEVQLDRHIALPVLRDNQVVALLVAADRPGNYTEEHLRQTQIMVEGCWTALERIRSLEALTLAKEIAEESLRLKTELLANLTHELRTPLHGIFGGSQLLGFTRLTAEQDGYLEMIEESAAAELSLINTLLELVAMETEGIVVVQQPMLLRSAVQEAVRVHQAAAREKGLVLSLEVVASTPYEVLGDVTRFRQILYSLLGNAVKFTDHGSITVRLGAVALDNDTYRVRVKVTDTGIGIAPEQQERIFELFSQANASCTRDHGGLGLGLAICRRLATAMGGTILLESSPGQGSSFTMELPMKALATEQREPSRTALIILLVENDTLSAHASATLLRKIGHTVLTAANGEEALQHWQAGGIELILMDIQMPVMNGFEAVRRIREQERKQELVRTPIIAQTAYLRRNYFESFIGAGFDCCLAKPLLQEELQAAIQRCLH